MLLDDFRDVMEKNKTKQKTVSSNITLQRQWGQFKLSLFVFLFLHSNSKQQTALCLAENEEKIWNKKMIW